MTPKEIVQHVQNPSDSSNLFRPSIDMDYLSTEDIPHGLLQIPKQCMDQDPGRRPTFANIHKQFRKIRGERTSNVVDHMMWMMEKYADHLEEQVFERTEELEIEKKKTDTILYQLLPKTVADKLKAGQQVNAEAFENVTIYFSDIVGFTILSAASTPMQVVTFLNNLYTCFDDIILQHDAFKVETIGDAYLIVSGLPHRNEQRHAREMSDIALKILKAVQSFEIPHLPNTKLGIRIGLHTGPCCAGVVGLTMPKYCLFGDSVNTASRMESHGEPMKIHISSSTKEALAEFTEFKVIPRGEIPVKGKGNMFTYWLIGKEGLQGIFLPPSDASITWI
ncbi:atrial natriuretic peptide receptor 1-like [Tubulanus polymorphus]|uniref:atrial natriuretic peptide receptor 1-like n=1 Tax=Tubulanus polymorphus TaxID=672921 RepID=UPI003DA4AEC4